MTQLPIELILLRQVAAYLVMPIFIVDAHGKLLFYNESAERVLGKRFDETGEISKEDLAIMFRPTNESGVPLPPEELPVIKAIATDHPVHDRLWFTGVDGVRRCIEVTGFPLVGMSRRILGGIAVFLGNTGRQCTARGGAVRVKLWGTRGSLATPGPDTAIFGGNTSCVEVRGNDGTVIVLDAGTGLRRLGMSLPPGLKRIDIFLTHLHLDHIQGLGFFTPLFNPEVEVHLWGPESATMDLRMRLTRFLSPPLFPVHLRDLPCTLELHGIPAVPRRIGELVIEAWMVCHPGLTVGYRVTSPEGVIAYIPDHEPLLASDFRRGVPAWTSGYACAQRAALLIHDAQYTPQQYEQRLGWGHCAMPDAIAYARVAEAGHLVLFHHDPSHDDEALSRFGAEFVARERPSFEVTLAREEQTFVIERQHAAIL